MAKKQEEEHRKWERVYENEDSISIWKYDSKISKVNPYQVEIKYKTNPIQPGVKRTKIRGKK
jgi:hypothetical protein